MNFCDYMMRSCVFRRSKNSSRHVAGWLSCTVRALVVRACADTRARTYNDAGGSEGARARMDRAAQTRISGGCCS